MAVILPGRDTLRELSRKHPDNRREPVPLRLVQYTHGQTEYALGSTLLDRRRTRVGTLAHRYHARPGHRGDAQDGQEIPPLRTDSGTQRAAGEARTDCPVQPGRNDAASGQPRRGAVRGRVAAERQVGPAGQLQAQPGGAGGTRRKPAAALFPVSQRHSGATLPVDRDGSVPSAP